MPRRRPTPRLLALVAAGVLAAAGGIVSYAADAWPRLENDSVDARFGVRGPEHAPSGIVIVAIDDRTFSDLRHQWPFPRRYHARLIDRLRADGARAIGYDVQFTEPTDRFDDDALYEAVARARKVVLATTEVDRAGHTNVLGGDANLRAAHAVAAAATFPADAGQVIRRYPYSTLGLPSFAVALARVAGAQVSPEGFHGDSALIDFRGPPGTIPTVSFSDVLSGRVAPRTFAGKIVLVGAGSPTLQDYHPTSTTSANPMAGVEVQASAVWTAVHGNPLQPAAPGLALVAIIVCALAAPLCSLRFRVLVSLLLASGVAAAYLVIAQIAFDGGTVLVVSYPLAAWAAGCVATLAAAYAVAFADRNAALRRLSASQRELIQRLAYAVESRDTETAEHTYRIGILCHRMALQLGWPRADAETLGHASIAHDIGKIGIPDSILLKPGPLTDEEWKTMQTHAMIGGRLLAGSSNPLVQMAETVALTHHEHWDGSGYPRGLKGEEIPLAGRICAVVDVYDALLSKRRYKEAWQLDEVLAEIERSSGTMFDPRVVEAFMRLVPRLQDELRASFARELAQLSVSPAPA